MPNDELMSAALFAATNPDPNYLYQFLLVISFLGNIVTMIVALVFRNKAQKREVSFSVEPASKKEFDKHLEDCSAMHARVAEDLNEADSRRKAIYNEIGKVRLELKADIQRCEDKVEDTPSKVIALLRHTGVIK